MGKIILMLLILGLIYGCVRVSERYTPDGGVAYSIKCAGSINSWDRCYNKAGDLCKYKGYEILEKEETPSRPVMNQPNTSMERIMVIRCK